MISFKKLQHYERLSRETNAYSADVYWHGRLLGTIRNDGNGGMSHLVPPGPGAQADIADATRHALSKTQDLGEGFGERPYEHLEDYIDDLAAAQAHRDRVARWLRRAMRDRVIIMWENTVRTSQKLKSPSDFPAIRDAILKRHPKADVINELAFEDALARLMACPGFGPG